MKTRFATLGLNVIAFAGLACTGAASGQGLLEASEAGPPLKGWGTSLAWWANIAGRWSDPAEFDALMDEVFTVDDGLGLTIVRFNIGAGQRADLSSGYMLPGRLMPSYQDGPGEPFVPLRDRAQIRVLDASIERGVQYVEANGNSPPWWMTVTQDSSGNPDGPNLAPENYDDYAEYLATVTEYFHDEKGIVFSSLTPLNEPAATWWDGNGNQEGCNIPQSEHPAILQELRDALDAKGLHEVPVSAPEEWSTQWTLTGLNLYPSDTVDLLSQVATHSYNVDNRAGLNAYSETYGKPLWMSEYGTGAADLEESAIQLARRIIGDFREMPNLEAWIIWQAVSSSHFQHTWSPMLANFATVEPGYTFRPQYGAFAQFSRFIRPGSRMIPSADSRSLVAYHPALQRLVVVALNDQNSVRNARFGLANFGNLPTSAAVHRSSPTEMVADLGSLNLVGTDLLVNLAPRSVTTFVIEGVSSADLPRTDWNADGELTQTDVAEYLDAFTSNADQTDINADGSRDFFDSLEFMRSHDAAGPGTDVLVQDFDGQVVGGLDAAFLGNGDSGGAYFASDRLFVQAFAAEAEEGLASLRLDGVTLDAGVAYTVRVRAADFNQNWTTGGDFVVGLCDGAPLTADSTPDLASATFGVSLNNGPMPMAFVEREFSFTPQSTVTDPYLMFRTDGVGQGNQRIGFELVEITRSFTP